MDMKTKLHGAYWISIPDNEYKSCNQTAYFRHKFTLQKSGKLELSISAHSRYRLWINGEPVTSGPCKGDRWCQYYETIDVSSFLREGENIIAVKVAAYAPYERQGDGQFGPTSVFSNAAGPCLIAKGQCIGEDGSILADIVTGVTPWFVCIDKAIEWDLQPISFWMGSMEIVHGERLPYGWKEESKPQGEWVQAVKKWDAGTYAFGIIPVFPLKERTIPLLFERKRKFVREMMIKEGDLGSFTFQNQHDKCSMTYIPPKSKKVVELDAGELTTGYFMLKVDGGKGSTVTIGYAESYSSYGLGKRPVKGLRDDAENNEFIGHKDVYYPSGNKEVYEPFWFRTFRFIRIEIETEDEGIYVYKPEYLETGYPLEVRSSVQSSEDWINPLWDMSIRTLQRCMHETYEDCPYYEQLQYTMDTRLEILYTYMTSGDTRLALKAIDDFHSSLLPEGIIQSRVPSKEPQVIPAFAIHWILMLEDYYYQTGQEWILRRYRPTVDAILDWYDRKTGPMGLVEKLGFWEFIDWVDEWDSLAGSPRAILKGPSSIHNMVYAYGLQVGARINRATGRDGVAKEYEERASKILEAVEKHCYNQNKGMYMEGPEFEEYSQQAQVWAVLTGLARGDKAKQVLEKALTEKNISICSLPMSFYLFRALEKADMYEKTEKLWDRWKMFLDYHLTTCPEIPINPRSDCHAWSALALYEFTRNFLGVNPAVPGWGKIRIEPKAMWLKDIKGVVLTPIGSVKVEWRYEGEKFYISVEIPEGIYAELCLPNGSVEILASGGRFEKIV